MSTVIDTPAVATRPARKLGQEAGKHHFFGYYNKSTWDKTGRSGAFSLPDQGLDCRMSSALSSWQPPSAKQ